MNATATLKSGWAAVMRPLKAYVHSDDHFATLANTGATIVWTHLPAYPLLVWWFAGRPVWPACVLLVTTPLFFAVPLIGRHHPMTSRALLVLFGIVNTLLAVKATGARSDVGWFLLPCLLIAAAFFRLREWKVSAALSLATALSALAIRRLGQPLFAYTPPQDRQLQVLNHWCVGCFVVYLAFIAARAQLEGHERD